MGGITKVSNQDSIVLNLLHSIYSFMKPGMSYSLEFFLLHVPVFSVIKNERAMKKALRDELKKPNSRLIYKKNEPLPYSLNPNYSARSEDEEIIEKLATTIYEMVSKKQKQFIEEWINTKFEAKLNESVERFVESEFKTEVLPVLKQHIEDKVLKLNLTKSQVKECVLEVLNDLVKK